MDDSGFSVSGVADGDAHAQEVPDGAASAQADIVFGWRALLDLDAKLHKDRNIRLLTPEARVLIHLKLNGPASVTTAMQVAGTSYRGFYAVLERLKQAGIIGSEKDEQDQRVRRLNLDASVGTSPSSTPTP